MSFQVLACGSNGSYQLGLGNDDDHDSLQAVIGLEEFACTKPKQFAFGGNHTFALYPNGELFATGENKHGQCGVVTPEILKKFTRVPGSWKHVAAGWAFSILCSFSDELYCCGYGPKGELGLGENRVSAHNLEKIELPEISGSASISEVKCSINHIVVKLDSGEFLGWGAARKGQLGIQEPVVTKSGKIKPKPALWEPQILPFKAETFCLGRDRTILVNDTITILGSEPLELNVKAHTVKAMWSSIHYIQDNGRKHELDGENRIVSVGNNSHGQCFDYNMMSSMKAFAVGSEHGLVLLGNNSVFAWGWGEHGNCGIMRDENVTFDYLNKIYEGDDEVVEIAGGLASTWLVVKRREN
ncbi:hypothetical protein OXX80_008876 [Metschnikowia pulcherrima]